MKVARKRIFDVVDRVNDLPGGYGESTFDFLNRVAGAYWEFPRNLLQSWADQLDDKEYADVVGRIQVGNDYQFNSAFLELYLHEVLRRAGATVIAHPDLANQPRHPDFLVHLNERALYVEAIAPEPSKSEQSAANRLHTLYDTINRISTPRHVLMITNLKEGKVPPSGRRLGRELVRWLADLDASVPTQIDWADLPSYSWAHDGWEVELAAVPTKAPSDGEAKRRRAIGVLAHQGARMVNDAPTILRALASKQGAYGNLAKPFVIAIGLYIHDEDRWHALNAFYGHERIFVRDDGTAVPIRRLDGYFGGPSNWKNRNVSGVLIVNQLNPYDPARAEVTFWPHPNPAHELGVDLGFIAETYRFNDYQVGRVSPWGDVRDLLQLPSPWPPGTPWPGTSG
ncbi:hypothetical protein [uncultured Pseudokineococcus sp.]|uniref:hypothetical protein n=1 Tax=uncultured Pseudokineococcus sp. TaxID=1642928 RepID=UPI0026081BFF|nr:hypothetical protein [uncultured Pseudokineococcus sp.]